MNPLINYISQPIKTAANYAIDNPISTSIIISAEKSLEQLKSVASSAASFGFENPEIGQIVYQENNAGSLGGTVIVSIFGGLGLLAVGLSAMQLYSNRKENERNKINRLRTSMNDNWERWENPEYQPWHPLRNLDSLPYKWEPAIKAADELGKGEEFRHLVEGYRANVGTEHLQNPNDVRVKNKDLEKIILGDAQTT